MAKIPDNNKDVAREARLESIRLIEQLIAYMVQVKGSGRISIEIPFAGGVPQNVIKNITEHHKLGQ